MKLKVNCYVGSIVFFANLAILVAGMYTGMFNGILEMDGFKDTFKELYADSSNLSNQSLLNETRSCGSGNGAGSDSLIGVIIAISNIGSAIGSLLAGWLSDKFSRKYALSIGGMIMLAGITILSASYFVWMLILGRLLIGITNGIIYVVVSIYIAEMTPKESRGMLGSTTGVTLYTGFIFSYLTNIGYARFSAGWRVEIAFMATITTVFTVGMAFLPHTPRWLVRQKHDQEALLVLSRINYSSKSETFVDTCLELEELRKGAEKPALKDLYQRKYRLLLSSALLFLSPLLYMFLFYYSTTIFCKVGVTPFISTLVLGLIALVASIVLASFVDKLGRKTLGLLWAFILGLDALIIAILLQVYDTPTEIVEYTILVLICVYAFGIACSWLTLPYLVNSEIFPTSIRGVTAGIALGLFWFSASVSNQLTPIIIGSPLQLHGLFYIVTALNLLGFLLILFGFPETKGVSLEQMDELFSQSTWEHFIGTFRRKGCSKAQVGKVEISQVQNEDMKTRDDEL